MKRKALVVLGMPHEETEVLHQCLRIFGAHLFSFGNTSFSEKAVQGLGFHPLSPKIIHHGHYDKKNLSGLQDRATAILQKNANTQGNSILAPIDHHMARALPFWKDVFHSAEIEPIYLVCVRDPLSSAMALMKRIRIPLELAVAIWTANTSQILADCAGEKTVFLFFRDWTQHLDVAGQDFLKLNLIDAKIDLKMLETIKNDVIKKTGPFHYHSEEDLALSGAVPAHTASLYSKLCLTIQNPEKDPAKIFKTIQAELKESLGQLYRFEPVLNLLERTYFKAPVANP